MTLPNWLHYSAIHKINTVSMLNKAQKTVLFVCLLGLSAVIIKYGVVPAFNNTKGDFPNYYTSARLLAEGVSLERAYRDVIWFQKQMDRYGIVDQAGGFIPHPPSTALVLLPLTVFPPVIAKNIWLLFNITLVIFDIILLCKIVRLPWLITSVLFLGSGYALLNNLLFGQQYLLLITSLLLGVYFYQRQKMIWAGIAIGCFIPVKYIGILFLMYFTWRKQGRLVGVAIATVVFILIITVWMGGVEVFQSFAAEVFPRHLRGEVQAPYAINFQSWNSLFRNLFLYHEALNTHPLWHSPVLFVVLKNMILWSLAGLSVFVLARAEFKQVGHTFLFHVGFIPLALLVNSPASVTYHFLLLSLPCVFFVKILLDKKNMLGAVFLAGLFILINTPIFPKLHPLVYPRLWLMLSFFVCSLYLFRHDISWRPVSFVRWGLPVLVLFFAFTGQGLRLRSENTERHAVYWPIDDPRYTTLKQPDVGKNRLVFSALVDDHYSVYSSEAGRWTPVHTRNFYNPALASDDSTLLVETMANGRIEIWISKGQGKEPIFLQIGQSPTWQPDGRRFAFFRDGFICLYDMQQHQWSSPMEVGNGYDLAFSPDGNHIAYCTWDAQGTSLHVLDIRDGRTRTVLQSLDRIETPTWSPNASRLLFAWNRAGNRDIWSMELRDQLPVQRTFHQDSDMDPVWFGGQVIFVTDRGHGLEMSALYRLLRPEERL